jgi:hypothetical protein
VGRPEGGLAGSGHFPGIARSPRGVRVFPLASPPESPAEIETGRARCDRHPARFLGGPFSVARQSTPGCDPWEFSVGAASKSTGRRCRPGAAAAGGAARTRVQCLSGSRSTEPSMEGSGASGRSMLEGPPSSRNNIHASFQPPPPDIPDNRENARTAHSIAPTAHFRVPSSHLQSTDRCKVKVRRMKARGRGVSQGWALSEPNNGCKYEGAPPPNRFGSRLQLARCTQSGTDRPICHGVSGRSRRNLSRDERAAPG